MSTVKDTLQRYGWVTQTLHWGLAALIIFTYFSGEGLEEAARADKGIFLNRHATLALSLMAFWAVRIVWRFTQTNPDELNDTKALAFFHKAGVWALYLVPVALAVSGMLSVVSMGRPVPYLGQDLIMGWATPDRALHETMEDVHGALVSVLMAVFYLHVLAALWHQFIKRDGALTRMLPWGKPAGKQAA